MFDIRYHWLSLAALFLALGLGILIGTGLGERGTIPREQARLVERLEASLSRLREENRSLRELGEQLAREGELARSTADMIARSAVAGRLAGRPVVLLVPPDLPAGRWEDVLQRAGARVVRRAVLDLPGVAGEETFGEETFGGETLDGQGAREGERVEPVLVYVNPPPHMAIPEGRWGAVVWDLSALGEGKPGERGPGSGEAGEGGADAASQEAVAAVEGDGFGADPGRGGQRDRVRGDFGSGGVGLPSDWFVVRAGTGSVAEWAFIEGLRAGWQGYLDATGPGDALHARLHHFLGSDPGAR